MGQYKTWQSLMNDDPDSVNDVYCVDLVGARLKEGIRQIGGYLTRHELDRENSMLNDADKFAVKLNLPSQDVEHNGGEWFVPCDIIDMVNEDRAWRK